MPDKTSYPLYFLQIGDEITVCFPEPLADIDHSEFWEATASHLVAKHYKIPHRLLVNLPYCQRRARVVGKSVYYGEQPDGKLLRLIRKAVGNDKLVFVHDDHEKRLPYDVSKFNRLVARHCPKLF